MFLATGIISGGTPWLRIQEVEILEPGKASLGSAEVFKAMLEDDPTAKFAQATFDRLILRRTKEQCLDLPEKTYADLRVELPDWQRRVYDQMRDEMVAEIRKMTGEQYLAYASTALAKLTRLIQIASNPALIFPELDRLPAKFEALDGLGGSDTQTSFFSRHARLAVLFLNLATRYKDNAFENTRFNSYF